MDQRELKTPAVRGMDRMTTDDAHPARRGEDPHMFTPKGNRARRLGPAFLAVALVVAACGGGDEEPDATEPEAEEGTEDPAEGEGEEAAGGEATVDAEDLEIVTSTTGSIYFPLGTAIAAQLEAALEI